MKKETKNTIKVAINSEAGGFCLSPEVLLELIKRNSKYIDTSSVEEWFKFEPNWKLYFENFKEGFNKEQSEPCFLLEKDGKLFFFTCDSHDSRCDKDVIETIELFGNNAGYRKSAIKIVEIPDDVEWEIHETDNGVEWIAEKHRKWY